jgi:protein-L-isoaspartate(D-aspartate) O-methyltransferase
MTDLQKPSSTPVQPVPPGPDAYAAQRLNMVDSQVRPSDVTDRRIIRAMGHVRREAFVPAALKAIAYMDNPITLARGQQGRELMEPRLFAKIVQAAEIPDGGRVMEIGSGSGYGVAVLAAMGCKTVGIEADANLIATGKDALAASGASGGEIKTGPFAAGSPVDGPFDAIIFSGSVPSIPPALFDQLKNGARLVAVIGTGRDSKAVVWVRSGTTFSQRDAFDATAAPLPGFERAPQFVF